MSPEQSTPSYHSEQPTFQPNHRRSESPRRSLKLARVEEDSTDDYGDIEEEVEMMKRKEGMQRYLVAVEYIGTRFCGSQQQPRHRTVMGVLQEAFEKFVGQPVSVFCSSRTDTGVHALSNVCHVDAQRISKRKPGEVLQPHEPSVVIRAVNHYLQKEGDIMVIDVRNVPFDFHARYKAKERMYYYRLLSGMEEPLSTFERDRAWHVPEELDLQKMEEACKFLTGTHDFSSFRASGCQAKSPIRTLDELHVFKSVSTPYFQCFTNVAVNASIVNTKEMSNGSCQGFGVPRAHHCLIVKARARSFLYHQVRLLVGVLKCVGTGQITLADVERILKAKDVKAASPMAPACGLYLGHVNYDLD